MHLRLFFICFILPRKSNLLSFFRTAARASSQGGVTHSELSSVYPILHAWAHKRLRLASNNVFDRDRMPRPQPRPQTHPESTAGFVLLDFQPQIGS